MVVLHLIHQRQITIWFQTPMTPIFQRPKLITLTAKIRIIFEWAELNLYIVSAYFHSNWTDACNFTWIINVHSPRNVLVFPIICVPRMFLKFQTYLTWVHWNNKMLMRNLSLWFCSLKYKLSKLYPKTQNEVTISKPMVRIGL